MKILLAVDGSAYTKKMLAYLTTHEEMFGSNNDLTLFTVQLPLPARARAAVGADVANSYYAEEAEKAVQHLSTIGIRRISVVYQNNTFGKEVFAGAQLAMERAKLPEAVTATVENDASDAGNAARKLADSNPEAVLIGLAAALMLLGAGRSAGVSGIAARASGQDAIANGFNKGSADATAAAKAVVDFSNSPLAVQLFNTFSASFRGVPVNSENSLAVKVGYFANTAAKSLE